MKRLVKVKFVPLVIMLITLGGCYGSCCPILNGLTVTQSGPSTYTMTWNPGVSGFPNVNLTLTPLIPPKALSWKPSDYVQVDLTIGSFSISTNDPAYRCLETVATTALPLIFAPENEVLNGFAAINDFLVVYQACGKFVQTSHPNLASLGGIASKELIFFQITGQKMIAHAANGQALAPDGTHGGKTSTPTPVPMVVFTVQGQRAFNEQCLSSQSTFPPFTLVLDNRGSNVPVSWSIGFRGFTPTTPSADAWATSTPANDTIPAGQTETVTITPDPSLCRASFMQTYYADVTSTANGQTSPPITITYTVQGVRNT